MSKKILVVDDEETAVEYAVYAIQKNGFTCLEASNGTELYEKAIKYKPDLIITDILMPGISGYKAIEKLRLKKDFESTPVIFCSGVMKDRETFNTLKPAGPCTFLTKPFDKDLLIKTINDFLTPK